MVGKRLEWSGAGCCRKGGEKTQSEVGCWRVGGLRKRKRLEEKGKKKGGRLEKEEESRQAGLNVPMWLRP